MGPDLASWDCHLDAREASIDGILAVLARVCSSRRFSAAHDCSSYDCGGMSMISVQPSALQKITARHLQRQAMLYVRQSTLHQVLENTESTARQYGLRERAIALGWDASRIVVIDQDLGQSGASVVDRLGFQHLVGSRRTRPCRPGYGSGGLSARAQFARLASSAGNLHADRNPHPG